MERQIDKQNGRQTDTNTFREAQPLKINLHSPVQLSRAANLTVSPKSLYRGILLPTAYNNMKY